MEYIRYDIPAERAEAFLDAYRNAGEHLRASPHCLRYEVSRGSEELVLSPKHPEASPHFYTRPKTSRKTGCSMTS